MFSTGTHSAIKVMGPSLPIFPPRRSYRTHAALAHVCEATASIHPSRSTRRDRQHVTANARKPCIISRVVTILWASWPADSPQSCYRVGVGCPRGPQPSICITRAASAAGMGNHRDELLPRFLERRGNRCMRFRPSRRGSFPREGRWFPRFSVRVRQSVSCHPGSEFLVPLTDLLPWGVVSGFLTSVPLW